MCEKRLYKNTVETKRINYKHLKMKEIEDLKR